MNLTTKAQRDVIDRRAAALIQVDNRTAVVNRRDVENSLMREFSIKRERALGAIARAVRHLRDDIRRNDLARWQKIREA